MPALITQAISTSQTASRRIVVDRVDDAAQPEEPLHVASLERQPTAEPPAA